jgi:Flp pilus assembly pilin Flp
MAAFLVPVSARADAVTLPKVTVVASGLNNPRGLAFGPGGALYVAEGGKGGTTSTKGQCAQVIPPIGPYTGGFTASISKISRHGNRTVVASGLPSDQTAPPRNFESGVADVAFGPGGKLFALISGAGCSHGHKATPNEIVRVHREGSITRVANLSAFLKAHPVKNPDTGDFEPDGTWYSFVAAGRGFYAVEPNHQELDTPVVEDDRERGANLVEYALLLGLIVLVCIGAMSFFGVSVGDNVTRSGSAISTAQ